MTDIELAQTAYEAYAAHTGGKTYDGRDMPAWDDLRAIQHAWEAAARAVRMAVPLSGESVADDEQPARIEP